GEGAVLVLHDAAAGIFGIGVRTDAGVEAEIAVALDLEDAGRHRTVGGDGEDLRDAVDAPAGAVRRIVQYCHNDVAGSCGLDRAAAGEGDGHGSRPRINAAGGDRAADLDGHLIQRPRLIAGHGERLRRLVYAVECPGHAVLGRDRIAGIRIALQVHLDYRPY